MCVRCWADSGGRGEVAGRTVGGEVRCWADSGGGGEVLGGQWGR